MRSSSSSSFGAIGEGRSETLTDSTRSADHQVGGVVLSPTVQDYVDVGTSKILNSPHVSQGPGRIANAPVPSVFSDDRGDIHRLRVGHVVHKHTDTASSPSSSTSSSPTSRGTRVNLLYSTSNTMRSGYLHPIPKRDYVLRGRVEVWTLTPTTTLKTVYKSNETFQIDAYTPHILHFLADTVLIEWWWWPSAENDVVGIGENAVIKKTGSTASSSDKLLKEEEEGEGNRNKQKDSTKKRKGSFGVTFEGGSGGGGTGNGGNGRKETTTGGDLQCWYYHPYRRIVDVHNSLVAPSTGRFQRLVPQDSSSFKNKGGDDYDDYSGGGSGGSSLLWWTFGFAAGTAFAAAVCVGVLGGSSSSGSDRRPSRR